MKVLIACDKFKGSMSAAEACAAVAAGLPGDEVSAVQIPVADGGEGMAVVLCRALGGEWRECRARDPLDREVSAGYAWVEQRRLAIVESSQASGLWRLSEAERDPWRASTRGSGDLIRHALGHGAKELILGLGGSATNDGGRGMAEALGLIASGASEIAAAPAAADLDGVQVTAACDVANPLLGENGCTRVFGPQKGVAEADFARHEERLQRLVAAVDGGAALAEMPGAGAAGGLGFACLAFLGAELRPGFALVAEALDLSAAVSAADLVITGEGSLDAQSLAGKAPCGVAALARSHGKPVVAFAGRADELASAEFDRVWTIRPEAMLEEESMRRGAELLTAAAREAWFELRVLR